MYFLGSENTAQIFFRLFGHIEYTLKQYKKLYSDAFGSINKYV